MTDELKSRLFNWKFASAEALLTPEDPRHVHELVIALSLCVGDVGWFEGSFAAIINAALKSIGVE